MKIDFKPKNKDIEQLMERLIQYPIQTVRPEIAQSLSRYKKIRYINQHDPNIIIRKGIIGLQPNVKIKKKKDGFFSFDIF